MLVDGATWTIARHRRTVKRQFETLQAYASLLLLLLLLRRDSHATFAKRH
jgi:hypothetical protein